MKAIILATAAVLTAGTAMAQTAPIPGTAPYTIYEREDSTVMVNPDGCLIKLKKLDHSVGAFYDGTTVIFSNGTKYAVLPNGEITAINSPYPSAEMRKVLTMVAKDSQRDCRNVTSKPGR